MFWITFDCTADQGQAVRDTLTEWVPIVKAKGKKVVLYGVPAKFWDDHAGIRQLLGDRALYRSKHRVCHKPLPSPTPLTAPSAVSFTVLSTGRVPNQLCRCKDGQGRLLKLEEHTNDEVTTDRRAYTAMMCRELLDVSVFLRGAPHPAGLSRGVDSGSVSRDPLMVRDMPSTSGQSRTPHHGTTAVCAPDSNTSSCTTTTTRTPRNRQHDQPPTARP